MWLATYWMILLINVLNICLLNNFSKSFPKESHRMHNVIYKWCHLKISEIFHFSKNSEYHDIFFPLEWVWSCHPSLCWLIDCTSYQKQSYLFFILDSKTNLTVGSSRRKVVIVKETDVGIVKADALCLILHAKNSIIKFNICLLRMVAASNQVFWRSLFDSI